MAQANPKVSALTSCYRGEKYLPEFLASCAAQTIVDQVEIVLIHNDPTHGELAIVKRFAESHPGLLTHVTTAREPLAISTNRAMSIASGSYRCIWNVDDLRTSDSLERMASTLDLNPRAGFTYGDFSVVAEWPSESGVDVATPPFERREFVRSMLLGPFYMWRSDVERAIGGWDEQFSVAADFDFAIRLALQADGVRTDGMLGAYLDEGTGLSTSRNGVQESEGAAILLRYGIYDKVALSRLRAAHSYRVGAILNSGEWVDLPDVAPDHRRYATSRARLVTSAITPLRLSARAYVESLRG